MANSPAARETALLMPEAIPALRVSTVDYVRVGELVTDAHGQLRDRMGRSSNLIEAGVEAILRAGGYGAKISGTGGCLFGLVPPDVLDAVLDELACLPVRTLTFMASEPKGLCVDVAPP